MYPYPLDQHASTLISANSSLDSFLSRVTNLPLKGVEHGTVSTMDTPGGTLPHSALTLAADSAPSTETSPTLTSALLTYLTYWPALFTRVTEQMVWGKRRRDGS